MNGNPFHIGGPSIWRQETPVEIGERFLHTLDALSRINPYFSSWGLVDHWGEPKAAGFKLEDVRRSIAEIVERGVTTDDYEEPVPDLGYTISAYNDFEHPVSNPFRVVVGAHAGGDGTRARSAHFQTGWYQVPDPGIVAYPVFKSALLTLVRDWELSSAEAYSQALLDRWDDPPFRFDLSWMTYLSAPLAAQIVPPHDVVIERSPDRGLLMIAAQQTFDSANREHIAAAHRIRGALAPLNDLEQHERDKRDRAEHWRELRASGFPDERFKRP